MTIGEKIRKARISKSMTQSELVENKITRNMLSAIESGKARPSYETIQFLAAKLGLPVAYLLSDEEDISFYQKKELMPEIKSSFVNEKYDECAALLSKITTKDDEVSYLLATCYFELARASVRCGALKTAIKHIELSEKYAENTIYDTSKIRTLLPIYSAIATNINSPLLEFDEQRYSVSFKDTVEYELYKYMNGDTQYEYTNQQYRLHMQAKTYIKERRYPEAIELLQKLEETKTQYDRNVYLIFSVYADLDYCYRQLCDFENAYRYATKRMSMLDGFNS